MASNNEEAIRLLRSIDASLKKLVGQQVAADVADDSDLDGKYGDPEVKFNPRDWTGPDCKGRRFSECPPEFLDLIAKTFDYFAKRAEETNELHNGKPVAGYKRKDAARARGWAKRIRGGWKPAVAVGFGDSEWSTGELTDSDVGF